MSTNNRMELQAAISALEALKEPSRILLFTDSKYVMDGIQKWIHGWHARGWRTASNKPVLNRDLWEKLWSLSVRYTIEWNWVRGHASNKYNNLADKLAREAIVHRHGIDVKLDVQNLEEIVDGR
jgi:ribonuclease HI